MTKTFLKRYWIILTSIGCLGTAIALACAGDYGEEYGTSNFTPEIFVDTAYSPFFYSVNFYYGIGHDENYTTRFSNSNVKEWCEYLGRKNDSTTIDYLLNRATAAAIDSAAAAPAKDAKTKSFLQYLKLAKKSEYFSLTAIDPWASDNNKKKNPYYNAAPLNKQLQQSLAAATDPFLQERYWFQLVRSNYFNGHPQEAISLFDQYSTKFAAKQSKIWYRTLAYKAGAHYKLKDFSKANYYYSQVYAGCDDLKTVAHFSFHPQEQKDWQATLALCRNNNEKATLWQMLGIFYSDPIRAINEIYSLDPKSDKLDLLLVRSINQSEQRFTTLQNLPAANIYDAPADSNSKALYTLVSRIADAGNTKSPWVWQLAAGYLSTLDKQFTKASTWLTKATMTTPKDHRAQAQLRLLKLVNTLASIKTIDAATEQKLYPEISWLNESQADKSFRNTDAFEWMKRVMAAKYKQAGEKVKAECFVTTPGFYANNTNVEALKAFLGKQNKTKYEELLATLSPIKRTDIFEYQAIQLAKTDHIDEAIEALKQAEAGQSQFTLPANPFNARINDCHDCDQAAAQKIKYTKMSLLTKLKELKDKIAAGQDVYTNATLFANAQYNISYYGNNRAFYECRIIGDGGIWSIDSVQQLTITDMATAMKYYNIALNAAQTNEQKAKSQYLLAKCQRNEWYNKTAAGKDAWPDDNKNKPDFIAWDGFKQLKQYSNTLYYKEVLKECGYFNTYISKKH